MRAFRAWETYVEFRERPACQSGNPSEFNLIDAMLCLNSDGSGSVMVEFAKVHAPEIQSAIARGEALAAAIFGGSWSPNFRIAFNDVEALNRLLKSVRIIFSDGGTNDREFAAENVTE